MNREFFVVGFVGFDGNFNFVQRVVNKAVTHTGDANAALKFETVDLAKDCLNVVEDVADNTNYDVFKYTLVIEKVEEQHEEPDTQTDDNQEGGD